VSIVPPAITLLRLCKSGVLAPSVVPAEVLAVKYPVAAVPTPLKLLTVNAVPAAQAQVLHAPLSLCLQTFVGSAPTHVSVVQELPSLHAAAAVAVVQPHAAPSGYAQLEPDRMAPMLFTLNCLVFPPAEKRMATCCTVLMSNTSKAVSGIVKVLKVVLFTNAVP
jgi:hypothetical protein